MSTGYVYCMTNPAMPGLVKIGYTERLLDERLQEANASTWVPQPFSIELAKFVKEPNAKEQIIHRIFGSQRVNPKREFFRVDLEQVKPLFDLMDGHTWDPTIEPEGRLSGEEVITLFLNEVIYPPDEEEPHEVQWTAIVTAFQLWKREKGYRLGDAAKMRSRIVDAYGNPAWGGGWKSFRLKTQA